LEWPQGQRDRGRERGELPLQVNLQIFDLAFGELVRQGAGLEVAGIIEVGAPVERREREKPDAEHVTGPGALDADRADDRVRAFARILQAPLGQVLDRDARLEAVQEMGPGLGIDDRVTGVDLNDVRPSGVKRAEAYRVRGGLDHVGTATGGGRRAAATEGRAQGEEARGWGLEGLAQAGTRLRAHRARSRAQAL
jgi:hypothetical protein